MTPIKRQDRKWGAGFYPYLPMLGIFRSETYQAQGQLEGHARVIWTYTVAKSHSRNFVNSALMEFYSETRELPGDALD